MSAEVPSPLQQINLVEVLDDHIDRFSPVMKVGVTIMLLDQVGTGVPRPDSTSLVTREIDKLLMHYHHLPPSHGLILAFETNAPDVARAAEGALDRLRGEPYRGYEKGNPAETAEFSILHFLGGISAPAAQLAIAKRAILTEGRTAKRSKEILKQHAEDHEKEVYPTTLIFLLSRRDEEAQDFGWQIILSNRQAGYDHATGKIPEEIEQRLEEMFESGKPEDVHKAAVVTSIFHKRTEGRGRESLRGIAIKHLIPLLDKRTVWMQDNRDAITSQDAGSILAHLTGPLPYIPQTRSSLERLVESYETTDEEPDYVKDARKALERHYLQRLDYDQALQDTGKAMRDIPIQGFDNKRKST